MLYHVIDIKTFLFAANIFHVSLWPDNIFECKSKEKKVAARKAKELERGRDLSCMIRILCKPREFVLGINGSRSVEAKKIRYCFNILLRHKMLSPFAL